ncbi:vWA domain-containing protein [Piscibacillus sp. B03]|uniref:vWA domain-containing protein n=1 Tax=Piscibacillus sp. B03 TaxID=3457430 RepID=UPI003FCD71B5
MVRLKWWFSAAIFLFVLISGCSNQNADSSEEKDEEVAGESIELPEAAFDAEGMVAEGPGELFSMDDIDEELLKQQLVELPGEASAQEIYNYLTQLLAADYQSALSRYDDFDPTFTIEGAPEGAKPEEGEESEEKQQHIALLMDASGSMAAYVGNETKMESAKNALKEFVSQLPEDAQIMLRVYGHEGSSSDSDKELSCASSEVVYPLDHYDSGNFEEALSNFEPVGWTPLAASIEAADNDLIEHSSDDVESTVYIISDGEETCGGDPVQAAKELHNSGIATAVNIIGFDVGNEAQQQLKAVAEAGGGEFTNVKSGEGLVDAALKNINNAVREAGNNIWAALEKTDINWDKIGKNDELNSISSEFRNIINQEGRLYNRAVQLLVETEQIDEEIENDLKELIDDRANKLSEFNDQQYEDHKSAMEDEHEQTINRLDEMMEKSKQ